MTFTCLQQRIWKLCRYDKIDIIFHLTIPFEITFRYVLVSSINFVWCSDCLGCSKCHSGCSCPWEAFSAYAAKFLPIFSLFSSQHFASVCDRNPTHSGFLLWLSPQPSSTFSSSSLPCIWGGCFSSPFLTAFCKKKATLANVFFTLLKQYSL